MKKFFQDLKAQFLKDLAERPKILLCESLGTLTSLSAAFTLAILGKEANLYIVLLGYTLGSIFWLIAGKMRNNSINMTLSTGYIIINIVGLIKLLLHGTI